jgi:hypothetical protein
MTKRTRSVPHPVWLRASLAASLLSLSACGGTPSDQQQAGGEPTAPSSEWVAENPTEPAVPVDLPTARMTNGPAETPSASPTP